MIQLYTQVGSFDRSMNIQYDDLFLQLVQLSTIPDNDSYYQNIARNICIKIYSQFTFKLIRLLIVGGIPFDAIHK